MAFDETGVGGPAVDTHPSAFGDFCVGEGTGLAGPDREVIRGSHGCSIELEGRLEIVLPQVSVEDVRENGVFVRSEACGVEQ